MTSWDFELQMGVEQLHKDCINFIAVDITVRAISVCFGIFENKESA